jgi:hypothetical protein
MGVAAWVANVRGNAAAIFFFSKFFNKTLKNFKFDGNIGQSYPTRWKRGISGVTQGY